MCLSLDPIRQEYDSGSDFWAAEPIHHLEKGSCGKAFQWALDTAEFLLSNAQRDDSAQLTKAMTAAHAEWPLESLGTLVDLAEVFEGRFDDPFATAVAHLLMGKVHLLKGEMRDYRHNMLCAMRYLGRTPYLMQTQMQYPLDALGRIVGTFCQDSECRPGQKP